MGAGEGGCFLFSFSLFFIRGEGGVDSETKRFASDSLNFVSLVISEVTKSKELKGGWVGGRGGGGVFIAI